MADTSKNTPTWANTLRGKLTTGPALNNTLIGAVLIGGLVGWIFGAHFEYTLDHAAGTRPAIAAEDTRHPGAPADANPANSAVTIVADTDGKSVEGAGVILTSDGYILTTRNLAPTEKTTLRVTTSDGRIRAGKLIGADPASGLAVIQVNADGLTPARFADRNQAAPGDRITTVSAERVTLTGEIASINEAVQTTRDDTAGANDWVPAARIDAGVTDPSRDGAPVFTSAGLILGITSATAYTGKPADNIGSYAINADIAYRVAYELVKTGHVNHGRLGANVADPVQTGGNHTGAAIVDITKNSPADHAGLRDGDTITAVNQVTVTTPAELVAQIKNSAPGTKVTVGYLRDGKNKTTTVTLGTLDKK